MGRLLIAKAELLFAGKTAERAIIQIEPQADEFGSHCNRVHAPMRAVAAAQITYDDQLPKLIVRGTVEPHSRPPQLGQTRK